jgi:hypothetical protein
MANDRITIKDANDALVDVSVDDLDTLNSAPTDVSVQRLKAVFGADSDAVDVADVDGSRMPVDSPTLAGKLDLVLAAITTLGGYSDQIEPLLTSLGVNTDGLEGLLAHGAYGYASGTAAATVDVPAGARVKRVSVIAGSGGTATVTIAGGATITIPAGGSFDEQIPGDATVGADVVIGGTVTSYYVGWVS